MKAILTSVLLAIAVIASGQKVSNIKMQSFRKPIVKVELNGKKAYFLIDTGASISVINETELKKHGIESVKSYDVHQAVGFNGNKENVSSIRNATLVLDGYFKYEDFYSMNLDNIAVSIYNETNIRISGIIGADLLRTMDCVIDYGRRVLTISDNKLNKIYLTSL